MEIDFIVQDHIACLTIDRGQRHIVGTTGCGRLRWDRIYELHHPIRPFCCPCRGRRGPSHVSESLDWTECA